MDAPAVSIRTPDQRIRVFVSSTLRELEAERRAAREAIESLHLAPIMFELGARPHPPRSLYRSYLAQSDIFVGIYGESYGWVAPGEEVSGLEDEYILAPALPKLIYVKDPAPGGSRASRTCSTGCAATIRAPTRGTPTPGAARSSISRRHRGAARRAVRRQPRRRARRGPADGLRAQRCPPRSRRIVGRAAPSRR